MRKIFKRFAIVFIAVCAIVCLGVAVAGCGDSSDNSDKHTITVVYSDGTPVNGYKDGTGIVNGLTGETYVKVQICITKANSDVIENCYINVPLGEDGTVEYEVGDTLPALTAGKRYHVALYFLKDGYTYDDTKTFMSSATDLTITVTNK
jgi:maltose-binding protein MalE